MAIQNAFTYITFGFYSQYNTLLIANTEIGLDPTSGVIKRLWCNDVSVSGIFIRLLSRVTATRKVISLSAWNNFSYHRLNCCYEMR